MTTYAAAFPGNRLAQNLVASCLLQTVWIKRDTPMC